jgi:hypothetical protein
LELAEAREASRALLVRALENGERRFVAPKRAVVPRFTVLDVQFNGDLRFSRCSISHEASLRPSKGICRRVGNLPVFNKNETRWAPGIQKGTHFVPDSWREFDGNVEAVTQQRAMKSPARSNLLKSLRFQRLATRVAPD